MRGRSGDCEGEQSRARGSYEASRAAAEPPQNPTSAICAIGAIGAELAAQSCDGIMNRPSKSIGHPYDGRRANWWATFHNRDLLKMAESGRLAPPRNCPPVETLLTFDHDVAQVWGRRHMPIPARALAIQIAAIAPINDLTLVTRNTADFARNGVILVNAFVGD